MRHRTAAIAPILLSRTLDQGEVGLFLSLMAKDRHLPALTLQDNRNTIVLDPQSTRIQVLALIHELVHMGLLRLPTEQSQQKSA